MVSFRRTVLRGTTDLVQQGYSPQKDGDVVAFRKTLVPGIECRIEFQLRAHYIPPLRSYQVNLIRRHFPIDNHNHLLYSWLNVGLFHLMMRVYGINIFPPGKFDWEFIDNESLLEQVEKTQALLLDYAIKWLEDPQSNAMWITQAGFGKTSPNLEVEIQDLSVPTTSLNSSPNRKPVKVNDILPPPFAWIDVPIGKVKLSSGGYVPKGGQVFDVPAFAIAKYPITNAQFAKFMEAGGYSNSDWWTSEGWKIKEGEGWVEPRFWHDNTWNEADYPVVGVSWYEAVAFCLYLSDVTGENIILPTEQQWQRAAQGNDKRMFPWGNREDARRFNNSIPPIVSLETTINHRTTAVTRYEGKGDSPFGVVDMVGNVWEWCLTKHDTGANELQGTNVRSIRGGSWLNNHPTVFRTDTRLWYFPNQAGNWGGFRIVRN